MNYHIYECDRCHKQERSQSLPSTWSSVKIEKHFGSYDDREREVSLCLTCASGVETFISNDRVELINTAYYTSVHNRDLEELKKKANLIETNLNDGDAAMDVVDTNGVF